MPHGTLRQLDNDQLAFSIRQVMAKTNLGRNSVLELVHSNRLKHVRIGRRIIIPKSALEEFLAGEK
jgi:excisionase family DNA binding protein